MTQYKQLYFIGLKGSGMCALALLLSRKGYVISGSDVEDSFYTDVLLDEAGIICKQPFSSQNIDAHVSQIDAVVYSAAYNTDNNEEMARVQELGLPNFLYPEALGAYSRLLPSCAVIGSHGKTTTTALVGTMLKALGLPFGALTGGRVPSWENNTVWCGGDKGFVAEVCEYRNHFEYFDASYAIFTSAELDHPDYFKSVEEVYDTFAGFLSAMSSPKKIIACKDSEGVQHTLLKMQDKQDKQEEGVPYFIEYGELNRHDKDGSGVYISWHKVKKGLQLFRVSGLSPDADTLEWRMKVPSKALVLNAVAGLAFVRECAKDMGLEDYLQWKAVREALADFSGVSRRCELLYQDSSLTVLDDYAHHPTAIRLTLQGIEEFYRPSRLIVDFMPHTFTRTLAFLEDFGSAFELADVLIINDIYSSPRERSEYPDVNGQVLVSEIEKNHDNVQYIDNFEKASNIIYNQLRKGDLVVTMGAGDNFRIAKKVIELIIKNV